MGCSSDVYMRQSQLSPFPILTMRDGAWALSRTGRGPVCWTSPHPLRRDTSEAGCCHSLGSRIPGELWLVGDGGAPPSLSEETVPGLSRLFHSLCPSAHLLGWSPCEQDGPLRWEITRGKGNSLLQGLFYLPGVNMTTLQDYFAIIY